MKTFEKTPVRIASATDYPSAEAFLFHRRHFLTVLGSAVAGFALTNCRNTDEAVSQPRNKTLEKDQIEEEQRKIKAAMEELGDEGVVLGNNVVSSPDRMHPSKGFLTVVTKPGAGVLVDGIRIPSPPFEHPLDPGRHVIQVSSDDNKISKKHIVTIVAGQTMFLREEFRESR